MKITVNSVEYEIDESHRQTPLLWVLRDVLGLKGSKYSCGIGACGSCTVLLDGNPVPSCIIPLESVGDQQVSTIEGLSTDNSHPLQKAWIELQVPQCGYCQSGQIMAAVALLNRHSDPDDETIKKEMAPVLCRCGTYPRILQAIKAAAREMKG